MMSESSMPPLCHVERENVKQYLGIRYADLEHRYAEAQICEYKNIDCLNATAYGWVRVPHTASSMLTIKRQTLGLFAP